MLLSALINFISEDSIWMPMKTNPRVWVGFFFLFAVSEEAKEGLTG